MPTPTERIVVEEAGGPEVLKLQEATLPDPGADELIVEHSAIGLNYIDVYFRTGLYPAPSGMPFTPGHEGAGKIVAMGENVAGFEIGDRIAYVGPLGSYARHRVINAAIAVKLPGDIADETGAAMMLKGMTARYLLRKSYAVKSSTTMLFHAAAGGVGLIAGQWARHIGATSIGTAGTDAKCALAKQFGFTHAINYREADFVAEVKSITHDTGCDVVYDSIGKDTFPASLDCLRAFGTFVSFGNASGPIEGFDLGLLSQKGSLFATRPTLFTHIATRKLLEETVGDLMEVVQSGAVTIPISQRFSLADAAEAHRALEARQTTGATILLPD